MKTTPPAMSSPTATQSDDDGHETPHRTTGLLGSAGVAVVHADAPVGFVEVTMSPNSSAAAHSNEGEDVHESP